MWKRGPLKILNGIKLILDDQGNHLDSYTISLESFRSFRGPLFLKPVTGQKLFFSVSYSKPTLARHLPLIESSESRWLVIGIFLEGRGVHIADWRRGVGVSGMQIFAICFLNHCFLSFKRNVLHKQSAICNFYSHFRIIAVH